MAQPTLIINDLKHGPDQAGAIGLWIGYGTDAHFTNLVVSRMINVLHELYGWYHSLLEYLE